jgi:nitrate reductase cytochrome c-type subunit
MGKRQHISSAVRRRILEEQKETCAECTSPFKHGLYDLDHVVPHAISQDNHRNNLRALCLLCHGRKTRQGTEAKAIEKYKRLRETRTPQCWTCKRICSPFFFCVFQCKACWVKQNTDEVERLSNAFAQMEAVLKEEHKN